MFSAIGVGAADAVPGAGSTEVTAAPASNRFGVLLDGPIPESQDVAATLGASMIRPTPVTLSDPGASCWQCDSYHAAGFTVALNVMANGGYQAPSHFPRNVSAYRSELRSVLESSHADLVVIENEPDSPLSWDGTALEYDRLLAIGCGVAHSEGVPCTDGGISSSLMRWAVYQGYLDLGAPNLALSYATRVFDPSELRRATDPNRADGVRQSARRAMSFVNGYVAAGADYVNFHWYKSDAQAFGETAAFLTLETGLPAMSNEIGSTSDDPAPMQGLMRTALDMKLKAAIWYSMDFNNVRALQNPDNTLRPRGEEFRSFTAAL